MAIEKNKRKRRLRLFNEYFDYGLLFITVFLVLFGLVMIHSASSYIAQRQFNGDSMHFVKQQALAAILGFIAIFLVTRFDYRIFTKKLFKVRLVWLIYVACTFLVIAAIAIGSEVNGKKRWLKLGPISFQPSELGKISLIFLVAFMISKSPQMVNTFRGLVVLGFTVLPMIGFVCKENMSTAIIMVLIVLGICFIASEKSHYYLGAGALLATLAVIYLKFGNTGYRMERIEIWMNVETHAKGHQIRQGLYAIASGGLFGNGIGKSVQKLGYLPEPYNDMIFAIICEELGMIGAFAVIMLFMLMAYRIYVIAINAPDLFGSLICAGVFIQITVQALMNVAVVTNTTPSTGVALPFVSYGGTSLSILLLEVGLVLNVSNRIRANKDGKLRDSEYYRRQ